MLDFDLPELYEVEIKVLNQAVKRNSNRFPERFMFRLEQIVDNYPVTICDRIKPKEKKH